MQSHLLSIVKYNLWANGEIVKLLKSLSDEQINSAQLGSFPSVYKTADHIYMAESIWLQRLTLVEVALVPNPTASMPMVQLCEQWLTCSQKLVDFVVAQRRLDWHLHIMSYVDLKKQSHKNSVEQTLTHVCNHSTYHRGQLINFARALGLTKVPSTDYMAFVRAKG
jgi:uncharacterized damage-inducible protein DinB